MPNKAVRSVVGIVIWHSPAKCDARLGSGEGNWLSSSVRMRCSKFSHGMSISMVSLRRALIAADGLRSAAKIFRGSVKRFTLGMSQRV